MLHKAPDSWSFIEEHLKQVFEPSKIGRLALYALVPSALFYVVAILVLQNSGFSVMEILRDPAQQSGDSSFIGFVSNIGIWLWVSSASICLFHALAATTIAGSIRYRELLALLGALSLLLAIDDFFMIHDRYVDQRVMFLAYAVLAGALLLRHYPSVLRVDGFAFLCAVGMLAASVFIDLAQAAIPLERSHSQMVEEGFKFCGAAAWLYFNCRLVLDRFAAWS